jgi:23S rRNA G2069 N7-methylase RlmK/C1962 C5-methylase RlmI
MQGTLDIRRDSADLLAHCIKLLRPQGKIYFSPKARGFKAELVMAFNNGKTQVKEISASLREPDFEKKRMPAVYEISYLTL